MLQVLEPHLNGPGGDVPVIVHDVKRGKTEIICGQGPAPAAATIAHYKSLGLDMIPGTGLLAACIPGMFDSWMLLLRDYGTMKLGDLIAPAGIYASDHDMFAFMVNEDARIDDGSDEGIDVARGGTVRRGGQGAVDSAAFVEPSGGGVVAPERALRLAEREVVEDGQQGDRTALGRRCLEDEVDEDGDVVLWPSRPKTVHDEQIEQALQAYRGEVFKGRNVRVDRAEGSGGGGGKKAEALRSDCMNGVQSSVRTDKPIRFTLARWSLSMTCMTFS